MTTATVTPGVVPAVSPGLRAVCAGVGSAVVLALLVWAVLVVRRAEWGAVFWCVVAAVLLAYVAWFPDVFIHSLRWMGQSRAGGRA